MILHTVFFLKLHRGKRAALLRFHLKVILTLKERLNFANTVTCNRELSEGPRTGPTVNAAKTQEPPLKPVNTKLAGWSGACSMKWAAQNVRYRQIITHIFFQEANNNGSALDCFGVARAKRSQFSGASRGPRCFALWVLLIITAPLEPCGELTFDLNKSRRTDAARLVQSLFCWVREWKHVRTRQCQNRERTTSGMTHFASHCLSFPTIWSSGVLFWAWTPAFPCAFYTHNDCLVFGSIRVHCWKRERSKMDHL